MKTLYKVFYCFKKCACDSVMDISGFQTLKVQDKSPQTMVERVLASM